MARFDAFEALSKDFDHPFLNSSPDYTPRNGSLRLSRPIGEVTTNLSFRDRSKRLLDVDNEKNQLIEVRTDLITLRAWQGLSDETDYGVGSPLPPRYHRKAPGPDPPRSQQRGSL